MGTPARPAPQPPPPVVPLPRPPSGSLPPRPRRTSLPTSRAGSATSSKLVPTSDPKERQPLSTDDILADISIRTGPQPLPRQSQQSPRQGAAPGNFSPSSSAGHSLGLPGMTVSPLRSLPEVSSWAPSAAAVPNMGKSPSLTPASPALSVSPSKVSEPRSAMQRGLRLLRAPIQLALHAVRGRSGNTPMSPAVEPPEASELPDIDAPRRKLRARAQTYTQVRRQSDSSAAQGSPGPTAAMSPAGTSGLQPILSPQFSPAKGRFSPRRARASFTDLDDQPKMPALDEERQATMPSSLPDEASQELGASVPTLMEPVDTSGLDEAEPESTQDAFMTTSMSPGGLRRSGFGSMRIISALRQVRASRRESRLSRALSCSSMSETGDESWEGDSDTIADSDEIEDWSGEQRPRLSETQQKCEQYIRRFQLFDTYWVRIVFSYTVYNLLVVPARIGLDSPAAEAVFYVDLVLDLIFVTEIVLRFFRPFDMAGIMCTDRSRIRRRYLRGAFALDVLQALPLEIISYAVDGGKTRTPWLGREGVSHPAWRANRLLLARHVDSDFAHTFAELLNSAPHFARIVRTLFLFVMSNHYVACMFLAIHFAEGPDATEPWTDMRRLYNESLLTQYLLAYDYSMKSMVGMGRPGKIVPWTDLQSFYCIFVVLMGVAIFALVLATISNLVSETVSEDEKLKEKINAVYDALNYISTSRERPLPTEYNREVFGYYRHVFEVSRVILGRLDEITGDMPRAMKFRMSSVVGTETMKRVPMFSEAVADPQFLLFMLSKLEPQVFCAGEIVMRKGDPGDAMYFLLHGGMGVIVETPAPTALPSVTGGGALDSRPGGAVATARQAVRGAATRREEKVVFTFTKGTFLGEIAVLYACRRTATIRALSYCSTFMLTRAVFEEAESLFPNAIAKVRNASHGRLQKIKLEEIVKKVPLFASCTDDPDFVEEVVAILEPRGVPEKTYVVRRGDRGKEMFFISQGELAVEVGGEVVHRMREGDFFGEIVLFFDTMRTASIVAQTYCDLFVLPAQAFQNVMAKYPQQRKGIEDMARARFQALVFEDLMKKMPVFADLRADAEYLREVAARLEPRSFEATDVVVEQGDRMDALCLVSKGELLFAPDRGQERKALTEGDQFGELALLDGTVRFHHFARVVAETNAELFLLPRESFAELNTQYPEQCQVLRRCAGDGLKRVVFEILQAATSNGLRRRAYFRLDALVQQARQQLIGLFKQMQEQEDEEDMQARRDEESSPSRRRQSRFGRKSGARRASVASETPRRRQSRSHRHSTDSSASRRKSRE